MTDTASVSLGIDRLDNAINSDHRFDVGARASF